MLQFLNLFSKPQQLSTYALTLFNYKTEVNGQKVLVGEYKNFLFLTFDTVNIPKKKILILSVLALVEVWEPETPKTMFVTSKTSY